VNRIGEYEYADADATGFVLGVPATVEAREFSVGTVQELHCRGAHAVIEARERIEGASRCGDWLGADL